MGSARPIRLASLTLADVAPLEVTELRQTSPASPAQWEGTTSDGRIVYVRYRSGWLEAGIGSSLDEAVDASASLDGFPDLLYREKIGGDLDGDLTQDEVLTRLSQVFSYRP